MRRHKKSKIMGIILLVLVLGIGYAYLNTTLIINGTTHVHSSTWDIYWDNIQVKDGSVSAETPEIDTNKTTVSFEVDLDKPGDFYEFTVDAKNDGNIDAMVDTILNKLNNAEISTTNPLPSYITYTVTYEDGVAIEEKQLLRASTKDTYKVRVEYKKNIQEEDLPENNQSLQFSFSVTYVQATNEAVQRVYANVIQATRSGDLTAFRTTTYREKIKIINLDDEINPPENVIESWDIGEAQNGDVMAYITTNQDDNTMYDLYIQGDGHLYANEDSSYLFYNLRGVDQINGIDNLDISKVTNMSGMFKNTGHSSTIFTLDLGDKFDTSNVTNMYEMFNSTGLNSTVFTLNLGNKFDTSNVTNMAYMFYQTGFKSTVFTLDLGNKFDTSNVTNMTNMFFYTGRYSPVFTLDLGNKFDTSNVTSLSFMFYYTGYNSTVFTLDLGDRFDTSNVTNMNGMFYSIGFNNTTFTLDLGDKFDTSNVTSMSCMFYQIGYNNPTFTLDLGDKFDTSNVTDMYSMFYYAGRSNNNFELDLSSFDFSKVTRSASMFGAWFASQKVYVKDASDQNWVITNGGSNKLTTSNVLIKSN